MRIHSREKKDAKTHTNNEKEREYFCYAHRL